MFQAPKFPRIFRIPEAEENIVRFKIGPFDCEYLPKSWDRNSRRTLDFPTLHVFLSVVNPVRTIEMQRGQTLQDAKTMAADIASAFLSGWLKEVADFKTENQL